MNEFSNASNSNTKKTYSDKNGYPRFKDSNKLVHRWLAEDIIGRKLNNDEVVHHFNGNKTSNGPDNLLVCSKEKHEKIHQDNHTYWDDWNGPDFNYPNI